MSRTRLASALALILGLVSWVSASVADPDMVEVRRLAREPVETILSGAPISRISDQEYRKLVHDSPRPVAVFFYANQDEKSRNLATLGRYVAIEFRDVISFYAYQVSAGTQADRQALESVRKRYGVTQIPATLFYDNDKGKIELEKSDYSVPLLTEYRTPSMFFWKTYHSAIRDYIRKNILD